MDSLCISEQAEEEEEVRSDVTEHIRLWDFSPCPFSSFPRELAGLTPVSHSPFILPEIHLQPLGN